MTTRILTLLFALIMIGCTKDEISTTKQKEDKNYNQIIIHNSDTTNFNIENINVKIFKSGNRNAVIPGTFFYLTSLSRDNFWISNGQNPRKHELYSHSLIDVIYFNKVSSGTIMVQDGNTRVECANYNITIIYNDGTINEIAWDIAPYLGEQYVINPTQSLLHSGSNIKKVYFELTRIEPILARPTYRPQNLISMTRWNKYHENTLQGQYYMFPEDFTSLTWRPKHRL